MFRTVKTPKDARGPSALKIIRKTSTSVFASRMPARSARHMRHSHSLVGARQVVRIDRQPWEERVAEILNVLEDHRYGRANALYNALNNAEKAMREAVQKKEEIETFSEELQAANEEMKANAEEMRAANEELRAISVELERMHNDVDHILPVFDAKLRLPLKNNAAELDAIRQSTEKPLDSETQQKLDGLVESNRKMEQLVDALVDYWKIDASRTSFETRDMNAVVETVLKELSNEISAAEAEITLDTLPDVVVDESQIKTLFSCLLTNALDHGGAQPPQIHIRAEAISDSHIPIPDDGLEQGWVFSFSDNGPGIEEKDRAKVFMLFSTVSDTETQHLGMGLAACWRIIKRHGGNIWVDASSETGSTFYFTLPDYDDAPADGA